MATNNSTRRGRPPSKKSSSKTIKVLPEADATTVEDTMENDAVPDIVVRPDTATSKVKTADTNGAPKVAMVPVQTAVPTQGTGNGTLSVAPVKYDGYQMFIRTSQTSIFKLLIEALKDNLLESHVYFNDKGLLIKEFEKKYKRKLIDLCLSSSRFEEFFTRRPFVIRMDIQAFFKLIKTMTPNNSILTLFIEEPKILGAPADELCYKIDNIDRNVSHSFRISLLELGEVEENELSSDIEYNTIISLPSSYFQKLCKDMKSVATFVDIKCVNNRVSLSCRSDTVSTETIMGTSKVNMEFLKNTEPDTIIAGKYSLEDIVSFTKCANLSSSVKLSIGNDIPLKIEYDVAGLGIMKIYITPEPIVTGDNEKK